MKPKSKRKHHPNIRLNQRRLARIHRWQRSVAKVLLYAAGIGISGVLLAWLLAESNAIVYGLALQSGMLGLMCASGAVVILLILTALLAFERAIQRTEDLMGNIGKKRKRDDTKT